MQEMPPLLSSKESKKLKLVLKPHRRHYLTKEESIAQYKLLKRFKYPFSNKFTLFDESKKIYSMKFKYDALSQYKALKIVY